MNSTTATAAPPASSLVAPDNWRLAIVVGVVVSLRLRSPSCRRVFLLDCRAHGRDGGRSLRGQCLPAPLFRRASGGSRHRRSVRHEHLSAAVVAGPFLLRLSGQPAEHPLRRAGQLHAGIDQRSRRHRQLERAGQHGDVRDLHRRRADDRRLSPGHACSPSSSRCANIC